MLTDFMPTTTRIPSRLTGRVGELEKGVKAGPIQVK